MGETKTPFQIIEDYLLDPMMYAGPERSLEALGALRAQLSASQAREREAEARANEYHDLNCKQAQRFAECESALAAARKALEEKDDALLIRLAKAMEQHPMGNGYDRNDWLDEFRAALNGDNHAGGRA